MRQVTQPAAEATSSVYMKKSYNGTDNALCAGPLTLATGVVITAYWWYIGDT